MWSICKNVLYRVSQNAFLFFTHTIPGADRSRHHVGFLRDPEYSSSVSRIGYWGFDGRAFLAIGLSNNDSKVKDAGCEYPLMKFRQTTSVAANLVSTDGQRRPPGAGGCTLRVGDRSLIGSME